MNTISVKSFMKATNVEKDKLKLLLGNNRTINETQAIVLTQKLGLSPSEVMRLFIID